MDGEDLEKSPARARQLAARRRKAFVAVTFVLCLAYADLVTTGLGCTSNSTVKNPQDMAVVDMVTGDLAPVPDGELPDIAPSPDGPDGEGPDATLLDGTLKDGSSSSSS